MIKTNELNALLKKMIGKPMTKEQREELERLREQVKHGELSVIEAEDIWNSKFFPEKQLRRKASK